jgi:hypothetical protein
VKQQGKSIRGKETLPRKQQGKNIREKKLYRENNKEKVNLLGAARRRARKKVYLFP